MAIISAWYDGPWTVADWAKNIPAVGASQYGTANFNAWRVTVKTGTDRTVNIAPGTGWGCGVADVSGVIESVQVPTISSGSRWDLIVARRNWATTGGTATGTNGKGRTYFTYVQGTSAQDVPTTRNQNPGVLDDQPIALIRVQAGQANVMEVIDLRAWSGPGGLTANSDLVKKYLTWPGTQVEISGALWHLRYSAAGALAWVDTVAEWLRLNTITTPRIRLTSTSDASETSTAHAFQIGPDAGLNTIIDNNEIITRNNGALEGTYFPGGATSNVQPASAAWLTRKDYVDAEVLKRMGGSIEAGAVTITPNVSVTEYGETYFEGSVRVAFTAGRFSATPRVVAGANTDAPGLVKGVGTSGATTTGVDITLRRKNTTPTIVTWIAVNARA